jgi:hypothetical protein
MVYMLTPISVGIYTGIATTKHNNSNVTLVTL